MGKFGKGSAGAGVMAAFEAKDKKADRKAGVKEGSKRDLAMDAKAMPAAMPAGAVPAGKRPVPPQFLPGYVKKSA